MSVTDKYTDQFQGLFVELKNYLNLQKQYVAMDAAEKLTTILSAIAVATICLLLGFFALLFCLFALAVWIGQLTGSLVLGALIMVCILVLILFVFYANRNAWVAYPIAKLINQVLTEKEGQTDADKKLLARDIEDSRTRINNQFQDIVGPAKSTVDKTHTASQFVSRGFAIYQGVRIGLNVLKTIRNLFGKRRKRR